MFQQAPRKERSRSAVFSAPANMLSLRNSSPQAPPATSGSSTASSHPRQRSSSNSNGNGINNTAPTTSSSNKHAGHGHESFGSYVPTSAAIAGQLPGPDLLSDIPNPHFQTEHVKHHVPSSDHTLTLTPDANPTLPQGVPQSTRAPQDPSHAPGVSFRSSLKPHRNASIPDIPYRSGQGKKRSVSIASSAAPPSLQSSSATAHTSTPAGTTTTSGGKARHFTPSDAHKGIRVQSHSASEKKALHDNTAQNAGHKQDRSTTIIASSTPHTQLYTPSAPLTVNAPVVPAGPQRVTNVNTEALEDSLRDNQAALANTASGGKQPPRSAMKGAQARSWADLVRPMNNVKLAEFTVKNVGLPEDSQDHDPAAEAAMAQFQGDSPKKKKVHIALPASSAASQTSNNTATPSKAGAIGADKSPRHDSPPPAESTAHHTQHSESHAGKVAHRKENHHNEAGDSPHADAKSIKSTTSTHTHGSVLDHYLSKKQLLEEILAGVENSHSSVLLYPRGLVNTGNACFMNAILQALLFTGPFYNLISLIGANTSQDLTGKTPLLDAMVSYLSEFRATKDNHSAEKEQGLRTGEGYEETPSAQYRDAFIPSIIYHALNHNHRFAQMGFYNPTSSAPSSLANGSTKGNAPLTASNLNANNRLSQEDAHEFLGFFLDTIHEELLIKIEQHDTMIWQKATKGVKAGQDALARQSVNSIADVPPQNKSNPSSAVNGAGGGQEDEDWLEVGQKGKTATTRTTEQQESAVTRIFGGQLRSVLRCPGQKDSVTLEPYTSLQLEIHQHNVTSITDALLLISHPETISDMTNKNKVPVEATKQVFIETLPPVLILHLKRFNYDSRSGRVVKSHKIVSFDTEFEVPKDCIGPTKRATLADSKKNRYRLSGVVYHHGKSAAGGHYSVAMRQNNGRWVNIDDTTITPISVDEVATDRDKETMRLSLPSAANLRGVPEKTAYLLFYQRI